MKRILSFILTLTLIFSLTTVVSAAGTSTTATVTVSTTLDRANALKDLGLFMGSDTGFDLDRAPARGEALVMLLRMLGQADEAKSSSYANPFSDVPAWAANYIAYGYAKGYTGGTSKTTFGTSSIVTPEQFLTFMLRALGYSDKAGEFTLNTAIQKAETLKLVPVGKYTLGSKTFYRGDCVDIIYSVLSATKKPDNITIAKYLIDNKAINATTAAKYGFGTTTPTYQVVRVSLVNESNLGLTIKASDVRAAISGAKYVTLKWSDSLGLTDYEKAYDVDAYQNMINPNKSSELLDYLTNDYQPMNKYKTLGKTIKIVATVYDEKANMIAAAIDVAMDAETKGYLDFALVSVNGASAFSKQNASFDEAYGNPLEYKNGIVYIEKALVNYTFISKSTGKVVSTYIAAEHTDATPSYRYVIDKTKYPDLAEQTRYFGDNTLPSGKTVSDAVREACFNTFRYDTKYDGTFGGPTPVTNFATYSNMWTTKAAEWSNARYVTFADANKKLLGFTSFVPSQLKVVDVGTVDQTEYVD